MNKYAAAAQADGEWADVRMTDPQEGEWDVDVVVADGEVAYVDLRVAEDHLEAFVECLLSDVSDETAARVLERVGERRGVGSFTRVA
jgi:hypothetical protein